jgi:uncharacterized LabA/DUF88 family protein
MEQKKNKVIVYIDGFNLYFWMIDAGFSRCKWLNVEKLVRSYLTENQELIEIKYFTSRIANNPQKQKRQSTYLEAIETTDVKIIYGLYKAKTIECGKCGHNWNISNEKMTDVNIATHLIVDAFHDRYDTAILISGDSDLVPPIKAVHHNFQDKVISVFFPPNRHNNTVAAAAKGFQMIGRRKLLENQFDIEVLKMDGYKLLKPADWL